MFFVLREFTMLVKRVNFIVICSFQRIMDVAEAAAEEANNSGEGDLTDYRYYNAKLLIDAETARKRDLEILQNSLKPEEERKKDLEPDYRMEMTLKPNKHFGGVAVNSTYSTVHVPVNIFDRCKAFFYKF